ncbi:coiled-coil domain-containing protein 141-like [Ornithodoros turicata]|uniref:coiled-coil domain-containing protein 141-like n=1 Tax=Ornithodoros turicata TaxID=34597 RepID=UPI003138A4D3
MADRRPVTTTLSTIAVQSGDTRVVIALLQSGDILELKIQELRPGLTEIGASYDEAVRLQQQHRQVLLKLQSKQSPVEELLSQADELIANQKPKAQVYAAMAHNLGLAWKDLNAQLEHRSQVLDAATTYHAAAKELANKLTVAEQELADPFLPNDVAACKELLRRLQDTKKGVLEAARTTLQPLEALQEALKGMAGAGSHYEALQDRRRALEPQYTARRDALERRLTHLLLAHDLDEAEAQLEQGERAGDGDLGDSQARSEILLHECESGAAVRGEKLRHRALRLVGSAERLPAGEDSLRERAYALLARVTGVLEKDNQRARDLRDAVHFFGEAQAALGRLDQLELQVRTSGASPDLLGLVDASVQRPLELGRDLLSRVPSARGVEAKVRELERRRQDVADLCSQDVSRRSSLYARCMTEVQTFLERHRDMGRDEKSARDFLQSHQRMLADMQGNEASLAADDIAGDRSWQRFRTFLEMRISVVRRVIAFWELFNSQANVPEAALERAAEDITHEARAVEDPTLDVTSAMGSIREVLEQRRRSSAADDFVRDAQRTTESAVKVESELYPAIPRELNRAETIAQYLERHLDTLMPLVRTIEAELEAHIAAASGDPSRATVAENLRATQTRFLSRMTEYQELVSHMTGFFLHFAQREKQLEALELSGDRAALERRGEPILSEAQEEAKQLASLVERIEPSEAAVLDRDKVTALIEARRAHLTAHLRDLERCSQHDARLGHMGEELHHVHNEVREVTEALARMRRDDTSPPPKTTLIQLERTIETLERRIETLITSPKSDTQNQLDSQMMRRELDARWQSFEAQVARERDLMRSAVHEYRQALSRLTVKTNEKCVETARQERQAIAPVAAPEFTTGLEDTDVADGSQCTLVCVLTGNPSPKVQWYKDGSPVGPSYVASSKALGDGLAEQRLFIKTVRAADEAKFLCKAINAAGMAETSCRVTVLEMLRDHPIEELIQEAPETAGVAPAFTESLPGSVALSEGQPLQLHCSLIGDPTPNVEWTKTPGQLRDTAKSSFDGRVAQLDLQGTIPGDTGSYRVVARNPVGQASCACQVAVASTGEGPRVVRALKDMDVNTGAGPVKLECVIVGVPEPEVIWYHDGVPLKESGTVRLEFQGDRCALVLQPVRREDEGRYCCSAVSPRGRCSTECQLRVKAPAAPVFLEPLRDVTLPSGARAELFARVASDEAPFLAWYKDGRSVSPGADYQITHDGDGVRLVIPEAFVEDDGLYEVEASNSGGRTRSSCRLKVAAPVVEKIVPVTSTDLVVAKPCLVMARSLPTELQVQAGTRVSLSASVAGTSNALQAKWYRGSGEPIADSPDFRLSQAREMVVPEEGGSLVPATSFTLSIAEAFPEDSGIIWLCVQGPGDTTVTSRTQLLVLDEDDNREQAAQAARDVKVYRVKGAPSSESGVGDLEMRVTEVTEVNELPPDVSEEVTTRTAADGPQISEEVTRRITRRVTEITKTRTQEVRGPLVYRWEFRQ